jgi:hypothetical protein
LIGIIVGMKMLLVFSHRFSGEQFFYLHRVVEIISLTLLAVFFVDQKWIYLAILFPIISTGLMKATNKAIILAIYALFIHIGIVVIFGRYFMDFDRQQLVHTIQGVLPYYVFVMILPLLFTKRGKGFFGPTFFKECFGGKGFP